MESTAFLEQTPGSSVVRFLECLRGTADDLIDFALTFRCDACGFEQLLKSGTAPEKRGVRVQKPEGIACLASL